MVTLQMIQEAQESLKGIARKTPLENANRLGENIYIKSENLQLTGAFKIRGAYNKIRSLTPEEALTVSSPAPPATMLRALLCPPRSWASSP